MDGDYFALRMHYLYFFGPMATSTIIPASAGACVNTAHQGSDFNPNKPTKYAALQLVDYRLNRLKKGQESQAQVHKKMRVLQMRHEQQRQAQEGSSVHFFLTF